MNDLLLIDLANRNCPIQPKHDHRVKEIEFVNGEWSKERGQYVRDSKSKGTFGNAKMECILNDATFNREGGKR